MLKRTPFYDVHVKYGAKLIDFGGFEMPVQYKGIKTEHIAVREAAGLFDVSHMGEFFVKGPEALALIQKVTINDASKLTPGKAQYSAMCYEDGGIVDDLLVYMIAENDYLLVVNASNIDKDFDWISQHNSFDCELTNHSNDYCLLALQGPKAPEILAKISDNAVAEIGFYTFEKGNVGQYQDIIISATGYTGEKGFELYFNKDQADATAIWEMIMEAGAEFGIEPCGLGARDTLRLEKAYALYGNDITKDIDPISAKMGWLTKLDKEDFIGKDAIAKVKADGPSQKLVGFVIEEGKLIARNGFDVLDTEGNKIGFVTSGTKSISLDKALGMAYVNVDFAKADTPIAIQIRNKTVAARVSKTPFL